MSETDDEDATVDDAGISRRNLVRLLVGAGIGIPVAVEARTLLELVDRKLLGGGGSDDGGATSPTATPAGVSVGDELLPATAASETVTEARVEAGTTWQFTLAVEVENETDRAYELGLGAVETTDGRVTGEHRTDRLAPGGTTTLAAAWTIPEGSSPTAVEAVGVVGSGADARRVAETVRLGNVLVQQ